MNNNLIPEFVKSLVDAVIVMVENGESKENIYAAFISQQQHTTEKIITPSKVLTPVAASVVTSHRVFANVISTSPTPPPITPPLTKNAVPPPLPPSVKFTAQMVPKQPVETPSAKIKPPPLHPTQQPVVSKQIDAVNAAVASCLTSSSITADTATISVPIDTALKSLAACDKICYRMIVRGERKNTVCSSAVVNSDIVSDASEYRCKTCIKLTSKNPFDKEIEKSKKSTSSVVSTKLVHHLQDDESTHSGIPDDVVGVPELPISSPPSPPHLSGSEEDAAAAAAAEVEMEMNININNKENADGDQITKNQDEVNMQTTAHHPLQFPFAKSPFAASKKIYVSSKTGSSDVYVSAASEDGKMKIIGTLPESKILPSSFEEFLQMLEEINGEEGALDALVEAGVLTYHYALSPEAEIASIE